MSAAEDANAGLVPVAELPTNWPQGYSTRQVTPEEQADFDARQAELARQRAMFDPTRMRADREAHQARTEAEWRQRWPDPRGSLRQAHVALRQALEAEQRVSDDSAEHHIHLPEDYGPGARDQTAVPVRGQ